MLRRVSFTSRARFSPSSATAAAATSSTTSTASSARLLHQLRHNTSFINETTKGNTNMKHLDIYARRDPQLAPYLLREVDIEYKRKCRKVNFVVWLSLFVCLTLLQTREALEVAFYLRHYTELLHDELNAKDDDMDLRRAKMVQLLQLVKNAEKRALDVAAEIFGGGGGGGGKEKNTTVSSSDWARLRVNQWSEADTEEARRVLLSKSLPAEQRKEAEGTRDLSTLDLSAKGAREVLKIGR